MDSVFLTTLKEQAVVTAIKTALRGVQAVTDKVSASRWYYKFP